MSKIINTILEPIQQIGEIATEQAANVEGVSATIEEITSNSQILVNNVKENI